MFELPAIDGVSYPATTTEIAAACEGRTVSLADGAVRVSDVYERIGVTTCRDAEEARQMFAMAVGDAAIGRKGYSDRDPPMPGEETNPVSL